MTFDHLKTMMLEVFFVVALTILPIINGDCPLQCVCTKYKIRCTSANLHGVPVDIPLTTEELVIEQDDIRELTIKMLTKLQILQLNFTNTEIIERTAFQGLTELTTLIISNNKLENIQYGTFHELRFLTMIDLSFNSISNLHAHLFDGLVSLRYLYLRNNKITRIPSNLFNGMRSSCLTEIGFLDFSYNQIKDIEPGSFVQVCSFNVIDFSNNNLTSISVGTFNGTERLKLLDLSENNITQISANSFIGLESMDSLVLNRNSFKYFKYTQNESNFLNVRVLSLSSCELEEIKEDTLKNFGSLVELALDSNFIHNISCGAFQNLTDLNLLELPFNNLTNLSSCMFEGLEILKILNIKENKIQKLEENTFIHLNNLQVLDLSNNKLHKLMNHTFLQLFQLKTLILTNNHIHTVHVHSFKNLISLKRLDLSNNNLTVLPKRIFDSMERMNYLNLTQNRGLTVHRESLSHLGAMITVGLSVYYNSTPESIWHNVLKDIFSIQHVELTGIHSYLNFKVISGVHFTKLDVYDSNVTILTVDSFIHLPGLQFLTMRSCSIRTIHVGTFRHLNRLTELSLNKNKIESLELGVFNGLTSLEKLDLDNNEIQTLDKGIFGSSCIEKHYHVCKHDKIKNSNSTCIASPSLIQLKYLNISSNKINYIHEHTFIYNKKLQTLDLSNNLITSLDFLLIPSLQKLILTSCKVATISLHNFICIPNLRELHLANNFLKKLDVKVLKLLNKLEYICTNNNPFQHGCQFEETTPVLWIEKMKYPSAHYLSNSKQKCLSLSGIDFRTSTRSVSKADNYTSDITDSLIIFKLYVEPVILIIILLFGIFMNGFIIVIFAIQSKLRTIHNAHLLNLAVADFLFLLMNLAFSYLDFHKGSWELDSTSCKFFIGIRDLTTAASIYAVVHWSFQRYNAVFPNISRANLISERKLVWLCILLVWGFGLGAALPLFFTSTVHGKCLYSKPGDGFMEQTWIIHLFAFGIFPFLVIGILNARVSVYLRKVAKKYFENDVQTIRAKSISKTLWVQTSAFFIGYFPNLFLRVLLALSVVDKDSITVFYLAFISFCLFFLNACFNPIAIIRMSVVFQEIIDKILISKVKGNVDTVTSDDSSNERNSIRTLLTHLRRLFQQRTNSSSNEDIPLENRF
ncbi:hypothetical protein C0J52_19693 [Blattella germanica]|nr:hypothetical protein C0J52_19693 [Blattella germanica]